MRVDIAVPCYKYAHFLPACVDSVLSQRGVDVRVLILDDQSPDETPDVARRLCADPRVSYQRNEKNLGLVGTANRGVIDWAEAPYTVLLSADDALAPGTLARATQTFAKHPDVGMVYGMGLVAKSNAPQPIDDAIEPTAKILTSETFLERATTIGNPALSPAVVVRTDLQKKIGGYNPRLPHTCDMEMWMRFAAEAPVAVLKDIQAVYAEHGSNMSQGYSNRTLGDSRQRIMASDEVFSRYGDCYPQSTAWRATQKRRLCNEAYWLAGQCALEGDKAGAASCLAFAREVFPNDWSEPAYWRFRVKHALGTSGAALFKKQAAEAPNQDARKTFGWWPE